ncbi:unnamed protein product [Arabis nemorensis]|uniref:SF3A3 domain-containing protein n=1 Tax=Arabis nemorensis TaxID=586526 RepID=A0A565CH17_9BRAS|nr:unnamed protein product [Arabis nemorensis]
MSDSASLEASSPASPEIRRNMLEKIRSDHEEIERLQKLVETYENKAGEIEDEIPPLSDQTTWTNVFSEFLPRLEEIHEYHEKHPSGRVFDAEEEYETQFLKEEPVIVFTKEEGFGRYLDLHDMYNQYINSDFGERVEYSAYLDVFSQPEKIPSKLKLSRQYTKYMEALLEYLIYFFKRTEPLQDLDRILYKVETDFEERYADGKAENHGQENELIHLMNLLWILITIPQLRK